MIEDMLLIYEKYLDYHYISPQYVFHKRYDTFATLVQL
jgi:hypothetical protein